MVREVEIRFFLTRNGADYAELYAMQSGTPQIRMNGSAEIKTSLSGDFAIPESVDWLSDEIRPELRIDGERYSLGRFLPATVRQSEASGRRSVHVEAYDRCWRVKDTLTTQTLQLSCGTNYMTAIAQLLNACGITLISVTPTGSTLAEDRADWQVGTSYLKIVNQLLQEINYNPLWFDSAGLAVLEPAIAPTAAEIDHNLNANDVRSLMLPQMTMESDVYQAPNYFVCVCSNPDKSAPLIATAENSNPTSPISTARRGRRITKLVRVDNVASQADLQKYANTLADQSLYSGERAVVQTALLPGWGCYDVTSLIYGDYSGIFTETAWSMVLQVGGTMSHTLERVVKNIG